MENRSRADTFVEILRNVGVSIDGNTRVLDLGCGAGLVVQAARERGYEFYGCGFQLYDAHRVPDPSLIELGILRQIPDGPYRLPFPDASFDVVISDQVFEHVMDYPSTLREIHRVLRPGGAFLHIFPSRYSLIEPHVKVPLASFMRARWWLKSWALAGVRNEFQKDMTASEAVAANIKYLSSRTNYLSKRQLRRAFAQHFSEIRFVEKAFLKNSVRGRKVYEMSRWLPILPPLYSAIGNRVAFGRRSASAREKAA